MKKTIISILLSTTIFVFLTACVKDLEDKGVYSTTEYIGTVVEKKTMQPVVGAFVQVTNGNHIAAYTYTDGNGMFSLKINFDEVDKNYYLKIDGSSINKPSVTVELRGVYQKKYDYGILQVGLPTFYYNGHTYMVAPNSTNKMNWDDAHNYCDNLSYYGYDDWLMPSKSELLQMYRDKSSIGGFKGDNYWSATRGSEKDETNDMFYQVSFYSGYANMFFRSNLALVRPIRIDL